MRVLRSSATVIPSLSLGWPRTPRAEIVRPYAGWPRPCPRDYNAPLRVYAEYPYQAVSNVSQAPRKVPRAPQSSAKLRMR